MSNVALEPNVLQWARKKAGLSEDALAKQVGVASSEVKDWESTGLIPIKLVEQLAEKTKVAFGFLFSSEPPRQDLPIADFRRADPTENPAPSDELLEAIYDAQLKQAWYREYLISNKASPLSFVGKASVQTPTQEVASDIRSTLGIGFRLTEDANSPDEAWRETIEAAEESGILVLCAGYVAGNTRRSLSVDEFRGFAMTDKYAPLVFVNGADALAARFFTLAHEIAHIWIGATGLSNLAYTYAHGDAVETYCNSVAAEVLLPLAEMRARWSANINDANEVERLARRYMISRLVVVRRARDAGFFTEEEYKSYYRTLIAQAKKSKGGLWYTNEKYQNSRQFSLTIIQEALAGRTSQRDAMKFLHIKSDVTFRKYAKSLEGGVEWPIF
jgi:Zn-dependent peptidase ImmA (M78 family)